MYNQARMEVFAVFLSPREVCPLLAFQETVHAAQIRCFASQFRPDLAVTMMVVYVEKQTRKKLEGRNVLGMYSRYLN